MLSGRGQPFSEKSVPGGSLYRYKLEARPGQSLLSYGTVAEIH